MFDVRINDWSAATFLEHGFVLAYEKHQEIHARWRKVHRTLEGLKINPSPHDAGDMDSYFDCLLRQFEDEQAQALRETGELQTGGRIRFQVQLTRYWLVSTSEMLRATRNSMNRDHDHIHVISALRDLFGAFRMPISKQQVQASHEDKLRRVPKAYIAVPEGGEGETEISCRFEGYSGSGGYRVRPIFNGVNGGVVFPVYDDRSQIVQTMDRRSLSEHLLAEVEALV
jgi:hypothetical protein